MKFLKYSFISFLLFTISCQNSSKLNTELENLNLKIKQKYAPDSRVTIFDINVNISNEKTTLTGETNSKEGYQILLDTLKALDIVYNNKIRFLPDSAVSNLKYAVARNSVINIRSKPKHSSELGTQGLLGMSLKLLDKKGGFYRVQTPDNYISWVDSGGIKRMTKQEISNWKNNKKIIFTNISGYIYTKNNMNSPIVSDITFGGLLQYISEDTTFYKVKYPDNRIGFVSKKEAIRYEYWAQTLNPTKESIESIAKMMNGFPYLWGGTSTKGLDCSGFVKTVYLMNGFIIPRDASQQINVGKTVDTNLNFSNLQKGDLMFFGQKASNNKKQKVTHVGIWLGNKKKEFIHSAGNVHISSMDSNHDLYDNYNRNRYLGSKRYLGIKDKMIIDLKEKLKL